MELPTENLEFQPLSDIRICLCFNSDFAFDKFGKEVYAKLKVNFPNCNIAYNSRGRFPLSTPFQLFSIKWFTCILQALVIIFNHDIIISNNRNTSFVIRALFTLFKILRSKRKHIYFARGLYFHDGNSFFVRLLLQAVEIIFCQFDDLVLCQSREDYDWLLKCCRHRKIVWVGNGVRPEFFLANSSTVKNSDEVVLGYVGRITQGKGLESLVSLYQKLKKDNVKVSLYLIGGPRTAADENFAKQLRLDREGIMMTGIVDDVANKLANVTVGVHLSEREGVPRGVCELLAAGKFVIGSNIRGNRELIIPWVNGILIRDIEEDYQKVYQFLSNFYNLERKSLISLDYANDRYLGRIEQGLRGIL